MGAAGLVLAVILVPFVLFGAAIDTWAMERFGGVGPVGTSALVVGLLASDVFLPVPSSFVSTAAGVRLGAAAGFAASWAGMTLGCVLGYVVGLRAGRAGLARWVGSGELARFDGMYRRFGTASVVLARSVPVLAEASVLAAGAARVPLSSFLPAVIGANAGISAIYAGAGAASASWGTFGIALAAAVTVPMVGYGVARVISRGRDPGR